MLRSRASIFFLLYFVAVVYLSLYPWEFLLYPKGSRLMWAPIVGRRQILDVVLNTFFYLPLGVAAFLAIRRGWLGWLVAAAVGCGLSASIEWLQLWCDTRYANLTDLAANSLGTLLGASAAWAAVRWRLFPENLAPSRVVSRWRLEPGALLLWVTWMLWQMFPFIPALSFFRLEKLPSTIEPWSWRTAAETAIGFAMLRWAVGHSPWLWVAWGALPAQTFLLDRTLSLSAVAGSVAGWLIAEATGASRKVLALLLPLWLVFEEFRPFEFEAQKHALAWAPFGTWYEISSIGYYPVLFGKMFLYLAVVWGLRERELGWGWAVGVPAVILAAGEWSQQYIPGRTPETTDVVVLCAAAVLLALCGPRAVQS